MKKKSALYSYLLCALFAALTAVCSQIMVPLPFTPVPINLAYLAVLVCGGVLGAKKGAIAMLVYVLLGAVGVPVFVGFSGGLGALAGPTGGYIAGYIAMAVVCGLLKFGHFSDRQNTALRIGISVLKGVPVIFTGYAFGTAWFMITMGTGLASSLLLCVVPFLAGDVVKIIAAAGIIEALRRALPSYTINS